MKKSIIGALVGAIIIFLWQFMSWTFSGLHSGSQQYTPKQDSILSYLGANLGEGQYYLPNVPKDASSADHEKAMTDAMGKPWAQISYHKSNDANMGINMARGLTINIVMVWLACWLFGKMNSPSFSTIFTGSIFIGLIVFFNSAYTQHIWFPGWDLNAHLIDALAGWGLAGAWLGWWLRRK